MCSGRPGRIDVAIQSFRAAASITRGIGMVARKIDDRLFIAQIYHGSTAQRAGLQIGDEIVAVDGKPYQPIAPFNDRAGQSVTVSIRRTADAAPVDIAVPVVWIQPNASLREAIRSSARTIERDGPRIGYLRVWTYAAGGMRIRCLRR